MNSTATQDAVVALRQLGTKLSYSLERTRSGWILGSSHVACDIAVASELDDVAPRHAVIYPDQQGWTIASVGDDPVLRDGVAVRSAPLVPGMEIGLGRLTFVVESPRMRALFHLVEDLIDGEKRTLEVDDALRALRIADTGAAPLVLVGDDLPAIALALHRAAWPGSPFALWTSSKISRSTKQLEIARSAVAATARPGTVCVSTEDLPNDFELMVAERREAPLRRLRVILCMPDARMPSARRAAIQLMRPVVLHPLRKNSSALARVVERCVRQVAERHGAPHAAITAEDRAWMASRWQRWSDIEIAAERVLVVRQLGKITEVARALGVTHPAITSWLKRHRGRHLLSKFDKAGR